VKSSISEAVRRVFLLHYAGGRENLSEAEEKALVWCILDRRTPADGENASSRRVLKKAEKRLWSH
jgi:hypothetical protein